MSTMVDSRIVEMRFDNRHFENNVSTTMSTLDKLKQKLHLDGATKGLESVNSAARKVDMTGLGTAVESVQAKFSAMQVIGVTALANITNSAVNAGKRIVSALTIDPVKTGFSEYELKMDSVKTIMASTGEKIEVVNKYLEELNEYSDQTIYSFSDMTQNIGKFTNAGVKLEDAVLAIKGISNEAALSGANANEASRAMYNFAQALSVGYIQRIDWKSIELANMATVEFKEQLLAAAIEMGTVKKSADGMYSTLAHPDKVYNAAAMFTETLDDQWLTTEVLISTLKDYSDATTDVGKRAYAAAQDVTKLSQMYDILKETAQSGWAKTWELIIGDLNTAKSIFTPLTNFFGGIIDAMSDARNRVLEIALAFSKPWDVLKEKLSKITNTVSGVSEAVSGALKPLEYFQDVVDRVWMGDFNNWGDNPDRRDLLKAAGYDPRVVQYLVNLGEEAWHSGQVYKLSMEEVEAAHKKYGLTVKDTTKETKDVTDATNKASDAFVELSDDMLKSAGLTDEEIRLYRALEQEAAKASMSVGEFADKMAETDGRTLLIDSLKNFGDILVGVGKAAKDAWIEIFDPPSVEEIGIRLYGLINSLKEFSEKLRLTDKETGKLNENGKKVQRTLEGVFAAVDIVLTVLGGPLKIIFKALIDLLSVFDLNLLDVTANIGDAVVAFRDWIDETLDFTKVFEKLVDPIKNAVKSFGEWIDSLKESENLPEDIAKAIASGFGKAVTAVKNFFKKIPELFTNGFDAFNDSPISGWVDKIGKGIGVAIKTIAILGDMVKEKIARFLSRAQFEEIASFSISGLVSGFREDAAKVWDSAVEMVSNLVAKVKEFLGIHSPSTVFAAIGGFIVAGLIAGLQNGIPDSLGAIKDLFQPMLDWINGINFGAIIAGIVSIGSVVAANKVGDSLVKFATPFESLGSVFDGVGEVLSTSAKSISKVIKSTTKVVKSFSKVLNGFAKLEKAAAFNMKMDGIKTLAISLLMLVGAIVVLTFFEPKKLWNAVGVILALSAILAVLAFAMDRLNNASVSIDKNGLNMSGLTSGLASIGLAILLLAVTVKLVGSLEYDQAVQGFRGLLILMGLIIVVVAVFGKCVKGESAENIGDFGKMMTKMAIALLLMVAVVKIASKLEEGEILKGVNFLIVFAGFLLAINLIALLPSKNIDKLGGMMLKMTVSLLLMLAVIKLASKLTPDEINAGVDFLKAFVSFVGILALIGALGGKAIDGVGKMMIGISVSMLILVGVMKLISMLTPEELAVGILVISIFARMVAMLIIVTGLFGSQIGKVAGTITAFGIAIAILAAVAILCGYVKPELLAKGLVAVGLLSSFMALMIWATRGANDVKGNIIAITVAIAVLAGAVALLTLIDPVKLAITTAVMSVLMGMLALVIKVAGSANKAMGAIIAITVTIAVLAGVLYMLSELPVESTIGSAIALGGLLLVMTGVLALMIPIGKMAKDAMMGVVALTTLAVPLALFALVLAMMSAMKVQDALPNVIALTVLCTALTLLLIPLSLIGLLVTASGGAVLLGVVALATMAIPLAAFVLVLAAMSGIQNGIVNAMALAMLMSTIGDVLFKISIVAPLAVIGAAAITAMIGLMTVFGVLATAIGALVTQFPQLQTFLDTGIPILEQLAHGLGSIIGNFISGLAGGIIDILPQLGLALSLFMTSLLPFITISKMVDESVLAGVGILTAAIIAFTVAELIAGVASMAGLGLVALGAELSMFMMAAMPFILGASMISEDMMTGVKMLAETILILTAANVLEGLTSLFTGGSSLENFASQLPVLGDGLAAFSASLGTFTEDQLATVNCAAQAVKTLASAAAEIPNTGGLLGDLVGDNDLGPFAAQFPILGVGLRGFLTSVGTFTDDQVATVNCAAEAIKLLAQASSEIPNSGGWLGQIVGENDLGTFASQFPILGVGLRGFLTSVGTFTDDQVATVDCAAQAIKTLAQASSEIPNSGGWLGQIVGENDLGKFASQFPALGTGLADFLTNVGTFNTDQVATVNCAADAIKSLASVASSIPNSGGIWAKIVGDNDLGDFAGKFPKIGEGIKGFASNLGTFTSDQVATVNAGVRAIYAIADLANTDLSGAKKNISGFGDKLPEFASDVKSFCTNMPGSATMNLAVANLDSLLEAVADIADANSGALSTFATNLKKVGEEAVKKFVGAFTSSSAKTDLKAAGKKLAGEAVDGAKSKYDSMKSAGSYLVSGFAAGITEDTWRAEAKAKAMANAAEKAAKEALDINSPSKVFRAIGYSVPEGFAMGIDKMGVMVTRSSTDMAKNAIDNVGRSISRISDMVNSDIDAQPTIRPVLDLTDVRTGANALNSMLDMNSSIGVRANVGAISSMMNDRSQNGVNADIVTAINKLRDKMDNLGNTTYQVNGVTYDDGSNVKDAVGSLVRAIRVERRV